MAAVPKDYDSMTVPERFRATAAAVDRLLRMDRGRGSYPRLAKEIGLPSRQAVWQIVHGLDPGTKTRRLLVAWASKRTRKRRTP